MKKKKRKKIEYCYRDYCTTLSEDERAQYNTKFEPLVAIITASNDDEEVLVRVRQYDAEHGTDLLDEAIKFTIYCIACHRVDCVC